MTEATKHNTITCEVCGASGDPAKPEESDTYTVIAPDGTTLRLCGECLLAMCVFQLAEYLVERSADRRKKNRETD